MIEERIAGMWSAYMCMAFDLCTPSATNHRLQKFCHLNNSTAVTVVQFTLRLAVHAEAH